MLSNQIRLCPTLYSFEINVKNKKEKRHDKLILMFLHYRVYLWLTKFKEIGKF